MAAQGDAGSPAFSLFNLPAPLTWLFNFFHCSFLLHYLSNCCSYCASPLVPPLGFLTRLICPVPRLQTDFYLLYVWDGALCPGFKHWCHQRFPLVLTQQLLNQFHPNLKVHQTLLALLTISLLVAGACDWWRQSFWVILENAHKQHQKGTKINVRTSR